MQVSLYILYGISLIAIVLGFIALLKQKTYIDSKTKEITEISVPFVGKMKTNYPSLIFLALGMALAFVVFNKSYDKTTDWRIRGTFTDPSNNITDFSNGTLNIVPNNNISAKITPDGQFDISMKIKDGVSFEEAVESIDYTCAKFSANILPEQEKAKKEKKNTTTLLENDTRTTRRYKAVPLISY